MSILLDPIEKLSTFYNMQSVSSSGVAEAISYKNAEHQVGYWLGLPMYEKTISDSVSYTTPAITKYLNTGVTGIVTVVGFSGVYIKGSFSNPSFVMNVPYTYIDPNGTGKFLQIYPYYDPANNRFSVYMGGTYQNAYYSGGYIYITFRYIKQTTP